MQKIIFILSLTLVIFSCKNTPEKESPENENKTHVADSISKQQQKVVTDSLKKKNPLLILPPDSNYTGEYLDKYGNGIIKFKGDFRFGKRHGQWMSFYPSGLAWSEMHYNKGLREGPNLTYFENGKLRYSGFYKNDARDSVWLYYDTLGKVAEKVLFKNDKIVKKLPLK
jgi:antitoxin component YwqK of YwqJK toxin-antitoxin module